MTYPTNVRAKNAKFTVQNARQDMADRQTPLLAFKSVLNTETTATNHPQTTNQRRAKSVTQIDEMITVHI